MAPQVFSRDGSRLCVARGDGSFMVVDGRTLAPVEDLGGPGIVMGLSSDGLRAVSVHDDGVLIHDSRDLETLAEIRVPRVMNAAFAPGDHRLFIGSLDGSIQVHDGRTYDEVARFRGHTAYVFSFAFDNGGERLFTGSGDGTIRLWETRPIAERVAARRERMRTLEVVLPRVRRRFDAGLEAKDVVARLRTESWTSESERAIALQAVLGESLAREGAPAKK